MQRLARLAINDEGFVFDPATGDSFLVNFSGRMILRLLGQGKNDQAIVDLLTTEYGLEEKDAERDVTDFRSQLKTLGIL